MPSPLRSKESGSFAYTRWEAVESEDTRDSPVTEVKIDRLMNIMDGWELYNTDIATTISFGFELVITIKHR